MEEKQANKRQKQAIETKRHIYEAALSLIQEYGFDNVQIDDIARRANVSTGLFYRYFSNKSDILTEYLFGQFNLKYQQIYESYLKELHGFEKIRKFVHYVIEYHLTGQGKASLRHHYANILVYDRRGQWVIGNKRPLYEIIEEGISEMIEEGDLPASTNTVDCSRNVAQLIRGAVFEYLLHDDNAGSYDLYRSTDHLISMYLQGMKVQSSPENQSV